jgi:nitroreductase/NAD-dependent dihydropyrimidine dehydrogenase PreA subunit
MDGYRVNVETCSACGSCVAICPERVVTTDPATGKARFAPGAERSCIKCGHCMAVCPEQAVFAAGMLYDRDFRPYAEGPADFAAFVALLERRRSVRRFKPVPVARELLERIVSTVALAPMGFPPHKTRVTVVASREGIEKGLPRIVNAYAQIVRGMKLAPVRWLIRAQAGLADYRTIVEYIVPMMQRAMPEMKAGMDYITHGAPAMLLLHAAKDAPNHMEDGHIAESYAFLAAHALGLGACAIGLVPPVVDRDPELRRLYRIPDGDRVYGCVIVGHPAASATFRKRAIVRDLAGVTWV